MGRCAVDRQQHLVQVPWIAWSGTPTSPRIGLVRPAGATPVPDGGRRPHHAAGEEPLCDISVAQAEASIEPHAVADDVRRTAVALVTGRRRWMGHA
jgi:hypothetical protein